MMDGVLLPAVALAGTRLTIPGGKTETGEQKKGASSTATIIGYATLGIGGLFAHNFVKGRSITLDSSKSYSAFVDNTVHVVSNQRAAAPANDGFAH